MKFALNYSKPAAKLLEEKKIEIDLFKTTEWDSMIDAASLLRPVYVHFPLKIGADDIGDLDAAEKAANKTNTKYVNAHCATTKGENKYERTLADLKQIVSRFGANRVIFENYPSPMEAFGLAKEAMQPEFLARLVDETGCGMIIDLAHATIAARNHGLNPFDYISSLPVKHIKEIHVTGVATSAKGELEDHAPMTPADWEVFDWALEQITEKKWATPEIISCEYGGDSSTFVKRSNPEIIAKDIPRMYESVKKAAQKMASKTEK